MAKNGITLRKADNIAGEIDHMQHAIRERAYMLCRTTEGGIGNALTDWFNAEHELVWKPPVELRRRGSNFEVIAATAGVPAKSLDLQVSPEDLLIKGNVNHQHAAGEGDVQICEFEQGQLFRSVHFPEKIDPAGVKAEYKDGLLRVTAPIGKATATKVAVTPS
jgi:HSP20 family molecular chaperone IbpA